MDFIYKYYLESTQNMPETQTTVKLYQNTVQVLSILCRCTAFLFILQLTDIMGQVHTSARKLHDD